MKSIFVKIIILLFSIQAISQKNNDNIWQMGEGKLNPDTTKHTPDYLRTYGMYYLDFSDNEMRVVKYHNRKLNMVSTNSMYCNDAGKLMFYTNGQNLRDSSDMRIPGATKVGNYYPDYWDLFSGSGYLAPQGALLLPWPGTDSIVLLEVLFNIEKYYMDVITATIIDNNQIDKRYNIKSLDTLLAQQDIKGGKLVACRHANGRDWWVTTHSQDGTSINVYIIEKSGFKLVNVFDKMIENIGYNFGQSAFSPDGSKFGTIDMLYWDSITVVSTFDFDRCTGVLSNYQHDTIANYEGSLGVGAVFSPSSRYFYVTNDSNLYQYDMHAPTLVESKKIVAEYDGFINSPEWPVEVNFGVFASGPDGRLYNMTGQGTSRWAHRVDDPDEGGTDCNFRQHILPIPNQSRSAPNFPNYRLGPLDGSSCDTLGLDNHPIAKYRYEPDSIDYRRIRFRDLSYFRPETWSWDFGDGSPKIAQRSPYHSYAQNGTYKVCLTVRNENSSHTFCRDITIGPSAVDDDQSEHPADVTLFPNPVQDILLVTIGEYIPEHGYIELYTLSGRQVHRQRAYYGHNNVDMSGMQSGTYILRIVDLGGNSTLGGGASIGSSYLIKEEKVVKI